MSDRTIKVTLEADVKAFVESVNRALQHLAQNPARVRYQRRAAHDRRRDEHAAARRAMYVAHRKHRSRRGRR